jgi:hypothetical protein
LAGGPPPSSKPYHGLDTQPSKGNQVTWVVQPVRSSRAE